MLSIEIEGVRLVGREQIDGWDGRVSAVLLRVRVAIALFILGLVLSGATAIPLQAELSWLTRLIGPTASGPASPLEVWLRFIRQGLDVCYDQYPFLAYGTDWLAFGHFALAFLFLGALKDPVRNIPMIRSGLWLCAAVIPFALIMGSLRDIPLFWRLIDCSFGVGGAIPLLYCHRILARLHAV